MNYVPLEFIANSTVYADHRHPVDAMEPLPDENRAAADAIGIVFLWVAQGKTLSERGYRVTVVLYCLKRDAITEQTLEEVGLTVGYSRQGVHNLLKDFKGTIGL